VNVLLLTPEVRTRASEIAEFASRPENHYRIGESDWVPGDRPEFVLRSGTLRAVFSHSVEGSGMTWRHLSVSNVTKLPNPVSVWTLARLFGFTGGELGPDGETVVGAAPDWVTFQNEEKAIAVIQGLTH